MFTYSSKPFYPLRKLLKGAFAGFVGTAPMTAVMVTGWQLLPAGEKYSLPPRQITGEIAERVGLAGRMNEEQMVAATLFSHFGYGALFGFVYAMLEQRVPLPPSMRGMLAGLAVWVGSYLGWLPAAGILPPATRHPWRRNVLMIVAHFVWGATMSAVLKKLTSEKRYIDLS